MQQTFSMSESSAKSTNAQFLNSPVTLSSTHRICLHMHKLHWLWVAWGIFTYSDVPAALHKRTKLLLSDLYYDMLLERDIIRLVDSRLSHDNVHLAGVSRRTRSCSSAASQRARGQPGCMVSLWDTRRRPLGHLIFAIPHTHPRILTGFRCQHMCRRGSWCSLTAQPWLHVQRGLRHWTSQPPPHSPSSQTQETPVMWY